MQNLKTSKIFKRLKNIQRVYYYHGVRNGTYETVTEILRVVQENPYILELLENANALKPLSPSELIATVKTLCDDLDKAKGR